MFSRLISFVWPVVFVASLLAFSGCAGSKSGSSSNNSSSLEEAKSTKVEDARRSAEDAEAKAHQIREEKSRNQSKTSSN